MHGAATLEGSIVTHKPIAHPDSNDSFISLNTTTSIGFVENYFVIIIGKLLSWSNTPV
jgi:hypothetical protein